VTGLSGRQYAKDYYCRNWVHCFLDNII